MQAVIDSSAQLAEPHLPISEIVAQERGRLLNFINQQTANASEAEDILQDVLFELVEAYRLPEPIEQVGAWLFRVARNRIIDRFRKKKEEPLAEQHGDDDEQHWLDQAIPAQSGPEQIYAHKVLMQQVQAALQELPAEQREVFIAHELDGLSFKQLQAKTGVSQNTLLSRKRYAIQHLRRRLQAIDRDFL